MRHARWLMAAASLICLPTRLLADDPDAKGIEFFENNIRPVLVQQCYKCHSTDAGKVKGGLLLDTRDGVRQGGETGHAVVPSQPAESLILSALRHEDFEMPPGKKLSDKVIADFEAWVRMGAPDPRDGKSLAGGKRVIDIEEGRKFWAFQPPHRPELALVKNTGWPIADIDRFILAELEEKNLTPAGDASPHELVRRIYFDLTGLPPTPQAIQEFETQFKESRQSAIEQLVDALLDSPQFGERWGRHWLDVARYADSNGNTDNTPFAEAWRFRNWVIDAVNADMPYDQFITEQLAGDLLPFDSPAQRNRQLVATGFLALGSKPRAQNNPNFAMDVVSEQIEVATSSMLGLTVTCARCHDHKFDPIPTAEFYGLAGIFNSTRTLYGSGGRGNGNKGAPKGGLISLLAESDESAQEAQQYQTQLAQLTDQQRDLNSQLQKLGAGSNTATTDDRSSAKRTRILRAQLARLKAAGGQASRIDKIRRQLERQGVVAEVDPPSDADKAQVKSLREELAKVVSDLEKLQASAPQAAGEAMGVQEGSVGDCAICIAGESTDRGPVVPRSFISVAVIDAPPQIKPNESGRLQLAQWIASPSNPLTARVMANRIWRHLFGRGIVLTVDNFGQLGERPTHPELLDYLAVRLVEENWSLKQIIREIMLTRTYQMSSRHDEANFVKDPDNQRLWRMNPRRLDAEELRDAILAFSGRLDLTRPAARELPAYNRKQPLQVSADGVHRSVYLPIVRNGEPEALMLFDFADPSIVVGSREETTVPAQSLYLMNSPFVVNQSKAAAERLLEEENDNLADADRVDRAFILAFGRPPTDEQRSRSVEFLQRFSETQSVAAAWSTFCQSLIASAEFRYLD
ncbi:PSD1 and planctomycete cytochrome C domain-containing protein [Lignipirellula cremea]|uniref:Planctomycete cytochrome C n=1 Tax=Lignipirellula cremea TaxID=2528010 RepID=A0A518DKT5_9BACT|nr:DUF1553 domain-containing protein [Lignipirellula cremea]QDU92452.1 Planctomycete cytochrome C [Lignipirellula cremea]